MIHTFLRSVGFLNLTKNEQLYEVLESIVNYPDEQGMVRDENGNEIACFSKFFGSDFGVTVCGSFFNDNEFRMEYYYPFSRGTQVSTREIVDMEKHIGKESYVGICDDIKLGITLIFYIDNMIDAIREKKVSGNRLQTQGTVLSALSTDGKILLPVMSRDKKQKQTITQKRMTLMQQAREGDRNAMEDLTLSDMDIFSSITKRIHKEDVLSIVESSFVPYGIESDQYMVIGEITSCYKEENLLTGENVWVMTILCNDMQFDVCINEMNLYGEPEVGRRFKGRIWMQGYLNF